MSFPESDDVSTRKHASIREKFYSVLSKSKQHPAIIASYALVAADAVGLADKYTKGGPRLRYLFPEPVDLFSHSGNFVLSMYVGAGAAYLAKRSFSGAEGLSVKHESVAVGAGVLATSVLNGVFEMKWGIDLSPKNIADPLDMAYGVAAGTVAALAVLEMNSGPIETEL